MLAGVLSCNGCTMLMLCFGLPIAIAHQAYRHLRPEDVAAFVYQTLANLVLVASARHQIEEQFTARG